jgi:copper chaperone CopZ
LVVFCILGLVAGCETKPVSSSISSTDVKPAAFNANHDPTVDFNVPDMMCPEGCGVAVKEILSEQPGVKDVYVDFDAKMATVAVEKGKFDADKAIAALIDRQFTHSTLRTEGSAKPQAADAVKVQ